MLTSSGTPRLATGTVARLNAVPENVIPVRAHRGSARSVHEPCAEARAGHSEGPRKPTATFEVNATRRSMSSLKSVCFPYGLEVAQASNQCVRAGSTELLPRV
jgi:hypothetical protein